MKILISLSILAFFFVSSIATSNAYAAEKSASSIGNFCDITNQSGNGCNEPHKQIVGTGGYCDQRIASIQPEDSYCAIYEDGIYLREVLIYCTASGGVEWSLKLVGGDVNDADSYVCSDVQEPPPECSVPAGTVSKITSSSPLGSSTCYQNCLTQTRPDGGISLMILTSGQRIYWYKGTSTGEYCEAPSGAESAPPFENYTDEDGCYMGLDGRYCPSGGGSCPNSATAPDGGVYCRTPPDAEPCNEGGGPGGESYCGPDDPNYEEPSDSDANSDSDGDGIPNGVDPHPGDPDADGDGTPDGEQDGDGNGIPDGEPGGIEDNDDGDGTEPGDGSHDGGTCTQEERAEPECHDMDATQCALAIELFHVRCDDKLRDEELYGTPEQREQIEQDTDNLLNDENPENQLPEDTIDFADAVSDLDDSSWLNGSCPSPISVPVMGTTLDWTFQPACDLFELLRPVIIALGYLAASLIILRGMQF